MAVVRFGCTTVLDCTLSGNTAGPAGGGIFNDVDGLLAVKNTNVTGNAAPSGADLYSLGVLILDDSAIGVLGP
jgi:hypothetical protein